jgi:uncharacterized protein (TIGR02001 family)
MRYLNAVLGEGSGGREVVRLLANGIVWALGLGFGTAYGAEGDRWGGSLDATSDYLVRGITRSNDHGALQLDLHYLDASGFVAGLFASNTQINSRAKSSAEIDAFVGFTWNRGGDWQGRALLSHYAYPWSTAGTAYNYDELNVTVSYREWLNVELVYSPDAPLWSVYRGRLVGVGLESAEVNFQHRVVGKLSATAGYGYAHFEGQEPAGYGYWSAGASYDLAPVTLVLSYVNTTAAAKALFYNAAADGRWTGTVIWRF